MNTNTRITLDMSILDSMVALAEGNLGAATCLGQLFQATPEETAFDLLILDSFGIYGSHIYVLWNDCCNKEVSKF